MIPTHGIEMVTDELFVETRLCTAGGTDIRRPISRRVRCHHFVDQRDDLIAGPEFKFGVGQDQTPCLRMCEAEAIEGDVTLSEMRNREFGRAYDMDVVDGPIAGVLGSAVVVVDEDDVVVHTEIVPEIGQEPDDDGALKAVGG